MIANELFPFEPTPPPLSNAAGAEMERAGCNARDKAAVETFKGTDRAKVREFVIHHAKHGAEVMSVFGELAALAQGRGWPLPVGADTLRGWARGTVKGFTLHNDLACFYVAALAAVRPDLKPALDFCADLPRELLAAGWKPTTEGGPRNV